MPLEKAQGIRQLMEVAGWKAAEVADNLGFSRPSVTKLLSLLSLPAEIREQVKSGKIGYSGAYELRGFDDQAQQAELADKLASGMLTRESVIETRKAVRRAISRRGNGRARRATASLGGGRSVTVCSDGLTLESFIALLEELLSSARTARRKNLALSTFCGMLKDQAGQDDAREVAE